MYFHLCEKVCSFHSFFFSLNFVNVYLKHVFCAAICVQGTTFDAFMRDSEILLYLYKEDVLKLPLREKNN